MRPQPLQTIFESASWYLSEKLIRMAGAFLIGAWMARYLGPQQYGTLAFAVALIATLGFLGSWGVESLVVRDVVQHPERESRITSTYFFLRFGGALLVPVIASVYLLLTHREDSELLWITAVLSSTVMFSAFEVADCWLQARHRPRATSLIRIGGFVVGAFIKCALVMGQAPLFWFACANVAESAFMAWAYWRIMKREGVQISPAMWDKSEFRALAFGGKGMILSAFTVTIYSKIDVLAVGAFISKEALGPYAIAATMCGAWNMLGISLAQTYAPHISAAKAKDQHAYIAMLRRFLLMVAGLSVGGSFVLAILSPWIFDFLLGPAYLQGAQIFSILVWASIPVFFGVATSQIIVNEKIYWVSLARTGLGMVVSLLLITPVALTWGGIGVAALVVASASVATLSILVSRSARSTLGMVCGWSKVVQT